jgi:hypothetical protein
LDFWFENKPSGNPGVYIAAKRAQICLWEEEELDLIFGRIQTSVRPDHYF